MSAARFTRGSIADGTLWCLCEPQPGTCCVQALLGVLTRTFDGRDVLTDAGYQVAAANARKGGWPVAMKDVQLLGKLPLVVRHLHQGLAIELPGCDQLMVIYALAQGGSSREYQERLLLFKTLKNSPNSSMAYYALRAAKPLQELTTLQPWHGRKMSRLEAGLPNLSEHLYLWADRQPLVHRTNEAVEPELRPYGQEDHNTFPANSTRR